METQNNKEQIACAICGKLFTPRSKKDMYCSVDCRKQAMYRKNVERKRLESIEQYKDNPNAKTCLLCGAMAMDLTPHITLGHKMTVKEYCEKFECKPEDLISKEANANRSKGQKNSTNPNRKRFTSENNPAKGHGGKFSPFSKNFVKYADLTDKEKEEKINQVIENTDHSVESRNTHIAYYTSRGMNEEEAKKALKERQRTFTKEKCIEKYGEEEGIKIWQERQDKWQSTLLEKPEEEQARIALAKTNNGAGWSKISQELFRKVEERIKQTHPNLKIHYATNGEPGRNNEWYVYAKDTKKIYFADFCIPEYKIIIEFDGDYWHGEARGNQQRDKIREQKLIELGYNIFHVEERQYKQDPDIAINNCINHINQLATCIC